MLLWLLSAGLAVLAAYIVQGWLRQALKRPRPLLAFGPLAVASLAWGSLVATVAVLSIAAIGFPFPVGFRSTAMPSIWLGSVLGAALALVGLLWKRTAWMYGVAAVLLAAAALPAMMATVWAVGFRPGVVWNRELLAAAAVCMILGGCGGHWLAFSANALEGQRRTQWRLGAAALLGLMLLVAQELVTLAAGLTAQVGSVYQREISLTVLALTCGGVLPMMLIFMLIDLEMRRTAQRDRRLGRDASHLKLKKRNKRRSRTREA
jgi:hypothetical protein